ncbi:MAG TPA: tyrosine-type recombinase/integrase [Candidatus Acidoferrales bacterium]|nr:tyrosine-type recombinase/integrase [Candidatus Acidoferrales bacterium]
MQIYSSRTSNADCWRCSSLPESLGGYAHRFRDTFAVELMLAGVPLEIVSVLLGHQSVRITERHYSPWVRARQEQLEADLQRAFASDPLVLMQTNHAPAAGGNSVRSN